MNSPKFTGEVEYVPSMKTGDTREENKKLGECHVSRHVMS